MPGLDEVINLSSWILTCIPAIFHNFFLLILSLLLLHVVRFCLLNIHLTLPRAYFSNSFAKLPGHWTWLWLLHSNLFSFLLLCTFIMYRRFFFCIRFEYIGTCIEENETQNFFDFIWIVAPNICWCYSIRNS